MRILWHSVAPWIKTGYGTQTEIFTRRIRDLLGHEVAISTWTMRGGLMNYDGFQIYPGAQDGFGNDIVARHARHFDAELVVTLTDSWVFHPDAMKSIPWVAWTPVDHDPVPPRVVNTLKHGYSVPVAYSRFGEEKLVEAGLAPLYVPHACHPTFFERASKSQARRNLGLPRDAYIVGMVGINQAAPNRKSYPQALEAFQRFRKRHSDAFLYMHTRLRSGIGLNLEHLIEHLDIDRNSYKVPNPYELLLGQPENTLRDVYRAIDVFLCPYMGEGFGIPIVEAQASGTPIVATNFSTMPELCFFGELIEGEPYYTTQSSFQRIPSVAGIHEGLERVYNYDSETLRKGSARARRGIRRNYDPDDVTTRFWEPALTEAKERIGDFKYPGD
ncbi:MAG: glycosyltransferase [Arenicellales bacterium]